MVRPANSKTILTRASTPKSYENKSLDAIKSLVMEGFKACEAFDLSDYIKIIQAVPHGPFLFPVKQFHHHSAQRPLDPEGVQKLIPSLTGADRRMITPIYALVNTNFWQQLSSPTASKSSTISDLKTLDDFHEYLDDTKYPLIFSHGHRIEALIQGQAGEEKEAVEAIYTPQLLWTTWFMPSCKC